MTFDCFMVWLNLCPSCCSSIGRLLHGICKYAGERIVAHGPLVFLCDFLYKKHVGTCLNCIDKSMQLKWVPSTYQ